MLFKSMVKTLLSEQKADSTLGIVVYETVNQRTYTTAKFRERKKENMQPQNHTRNIQYIRIWFES